MHKLRGGIKVGSYGKIHIDHSYYGPWLDVDSMSIFDKSVMIRNVMQPKTDEECEELDRLVVEAGVENGMKINDPEACKLRDLTSIWKEKRNGSARESY